MEEKSIATNASVPSTSSYLHPTVSSGKIFIKNSDNFIKKGKVTPFHRLRFKELTLRGKTLLQYSEAQGTSSGPFWQEYCQRARHAFDFENVREEQFNSQQLQSYIEKNREGKREKKRGFKKLLCNAISLCQ